MTQVRPSELAALRAKERAHDQYLRATRLMKVRSELLLADQTVPADFRAGWKACLREWSRAILDAMGDDR